MDDFMMRTVTASAEFTDNEGGKLKVTVSRMRNSADFASICMDVNGKRVLDLTNDLESYEEAARSIGKLLQEAANEPCALPVAADASTSREDGPPTCTPGSHDWDFDNGMCRKCFATNLWSGPAPSGRRSSSRGGDR